MSVGRGARGVFLLVHFSFDKERKVTRPLCGRNALHLQIQKQIHPWFDRLTTNGINQSTATACACSRVAANRTSGARSIASCRFTRVGAR